MAENGYGKTWAFEKMIGDGELGNNPPPWSSPSSSNGVVSPGTCYCPLGLTRYEDSRFVRSLSSSGGRASQHSPSSSSSTGFFSDGSSSAAFDDTPRYQTRSTTTATASTNSRYSDYGLWSDSNARPYYYYYPADNYLVNDNPRLLESFCRLNIGDTRGEERTKTMVSGVERDGSGFDGSWSYGGDSRNSYSSGLIKTQTRCHSREFQSQNPVSDDFVWSQSHGRLDSNGKNGLNRGLFSPQAQALRHNLAVNTNSPLRTKRYQRGEVADLEGFSCEDSFIIEGQCSRKNSHNGVGFGNSRDRSFGLPDFRPSHGGIYENGIYDIYESAKDHESCRELQRWVELGTNQDVRMVFDHIIDHVVELSTNPFGNYLVQKLLDCGTELQKLEIALMLARQPGELVRISQNSHGTRVVQKLIETAKNRSYLSLVKSALEPGFLVLTMDLNGNHVLHRCLKCLSSEDNANLVTRRCDHKTLRERADFAGNLGITLFKAIMKLRNSIDSSEHANSATQSSEFIFNAAARFCVEIATHRTGCCVLQRCIEHSTGIFQHILVAEISRNALLLAQDPFGNYVVQFVMEHVPSAAAKLLPHFKGQFEHLSTQKFSSYVVQRFLEHCRESRPIIVNELMAVPHFECLLQDAYANYVISTALNFTKGTLHESLAKKVIEFKSKVEHNLHSKKLCRKMKSSDEVICYKTIN